MAVATGTSAECAVAAWSSEVTGSSGVLVVENAKDAADIPNM